MEFRTELGSTVFNMKYKHSSCETWPALANTCVRHVCGGLLSNAEIETLIKHITLMKFIPAGRYLYYAGRSTAFFNNCFAMRAEDSREGWSELMQNASSALMCGGGVGVDYSKIRGAGLLLRRTGGTASGPIPLMQILNEIGRHVMQGGSRRSALWAGLNWNHPDIENFITLKDWSTVVKAEKAKDYNFPATLDMTNISVLFDSAWQKGKNNDVFNQVVRKMCETGEPGMAFNFGNHENETLRNACCEFITNEDSDVCNLGSVNMGAIGSQGEFEEVVNLASKFLMCGSIKADLPYQKVKDVRERSRKIGLGLMGVHEWLLKRKEKYEVTPELRTWLTIYATASEHYANRQADKLGISRAVRYRAIAPAGTISIIAGTSSGIEPLFSVACKRRYLAGEKDWKYQYMIDPTAQFLMDTYNLNPDEIETAYKLAEEPERRVKFQAGIQDFVDMGISSTINLPDWGSELNNEKTVPELAKILLKYRHRLRGITTYPNNARDGQTLSEVPYETAKGKEGVEYEDFASERQCKSGVCGV